MSDTVQTDLAFDVPLRGVQAIEASAGTGKTYALAGIHARLIVEAAHEVREILVVTYTRAAADELRARLRERLALCAQIAAHAQALYDDDKPEVEFCRGLIARALAAGEAREHLLRRLRIAALSLDEAQISTVHAFCERALRELSWGVGVPALDGELIDTTALIDELAADLWRECATGADTLAWNALLAVVKSAEGFIQLLRELRDPDSRLEPDVAASAETLRTQIAEGDIAWENLSELWRAQGPEAFVALIQHVRDGHISKSSYKESKVADVAREIGQAFACDARPDLKLLQHYTSAAIALKQNKNARPLPTQAFFEALAATVSVRESAELALRQLGLHVLRDRVDEMRRRLQRRQRETRVYSYDDLIVRLHEAVCGPHGAAAAQALAQRFRAALVDECQDSDARQFDIFFAVYRQRGLLCLVGDPKQAIYRFRGGDVHAYLRARDRADARHALDRNFRSTPALIDALNRLYLGAGARAFDDAQISYTPVHAGGTTRDDDLLIEGSATAPLRIWDVAEKLSSKDEGKQLLAAGCAEEIVRLLTLAHAGKAQLRRKQDDAPRRYEALRADDLAVLVSAHHEAAAMQRALTERGVPSVLVTRASVFASDEARELLALLRALDSFDPARLRGALSTHLLGKTLSELAALAADGQSWQEQALRFADWRELWQRRGVLALIEQVAENAASTLLAQVDGERRLTNLLHLAELLQQAEQERDGARAVIDWLQQRIVQADENREEEQLRLESDAGRVHVVTVHTSKGLEYPIVFLPFAPLRRNPRSGKAVETYARFERTHRIVHLCATGSDDTQARARERDEAQAESQRLLYVALTRARVACYVAWGEIGKGAQPSALAALLGAGTDSVPGTMSTRLEQLAAEAPASIACSALPEPSTRRAPQPEVEGTASVRHAKRRVDERRSSHSFSRLSASGHDSARIGAEIARGDDESTIDVVGLDLPAAVPNTLRGARFGTAFHELMEKVDFHAWRDWSAPTPPAAQRELVARVLHRHALDSQVSEAVLHAAFVRLISATLNSPLPLGSRLADLAPAQYRAEMPFHFAIDDTDAQHWLACMHAHGYLHARTRFMLDANRLAGQMTGVLDLVVLHDARWWVIDYKTNLLGRDTPQDYVPARLASAVAEGEYDLQYLIYLVALHRWLKARLGAGYDYERDIGGALYLFVRGLDRGGVNGMHQDKPPAALIEELDQVLAAPPQGTHEAAA